jgi:hypothetical protein
LNVTKILMRQRVWHRASKRIASKRSKSMKNIFLSLAIAATFARAQAANAGSDVGSTYIAP